MVHIRQGALCGRACLKLKIFHNYRRCKSYMKTFIYTATDVQGNTIKNARMTAEDVNDFLEKIHDKGLFCSSYKEASSKNSNTLHKFTTKELSNDCRQLSAMLTSGLTLVKALDILYKEQEKKAQKQIYQEIYEGVQRRLEDNYAKEAKLNNKIKSSMMYPIILAVLCVAIVVLLFTFIMPTFKDMMREEDMKGITGMLFAFSDSLIGYWYVYIAVILGVIFVVKYSLKVPSVHYKWDKLKCKGPGFGKLVVKVYTGKFARTLSSLYSSGIPMVEALERSAAILNNDYIEEAFKTVVDEVKQGEQLSVSIQRTNIFESMFVSIIYVGEESGALDTILTKSAEFYEDESDAAIGRLVGMIEPVMIIFMGTAIGFVIAGILPALYGTFENIQ